jgi:histidyl-tRNA synthetase
MTFQAPKGVSEYVPPRSAAHHEAVRGMLTALGIPFTDAPRLVRGLDYYNRTTCEFDHALPGTGFAAGLDRIVLAIESERTVASAKRGATGCRVFGVPLGEDAHADMLTLVTALRRTGIRADMAFGARGLKGAMKAADRSGATHAVLLGDQERRHGLVRMKDLKNGDQHDVAASEATAWLTERLATPE